MNLDVNDLEYGTPATVVTDQFVTFPPQYSQSSTDGVWSVTTLSNSAGATRHEGHRFDHTVVLYTDIKRDKPVAMSEVEPYDDIYSTGERQFGTLVDVDGEGVFVEGFVLFGTDAEGRDTTDMPEKGRDGVAFGGLISSSQFPKDGLSKSSFTFTINAADDDDPNTPMVEVVNDTVRFSGSLDGALGTFSCFGGSGPTPACELQHRGTTDRGDFYIFKEGGWTFIPNSGAMVQVEDHNYMSFGWWKRENTDNNDLAYLAFSTGKVPVSDTSPSFTSLEGTATYVGLAVGQYSIHQPAARPTQYDAGSFRAIARLDADFGDDVADGDAHGTISGTITNFNVGTDWSLTLKSALLLDSGKTGDGQGTTGVQPSVDWTIGSITRGGGEWNGQFYSDVDSYPIDGPGPGYVGEVPAGISGTFSAVFDDVGALIGAYGAHLQ